MSAIVYGENLNGLELLRQLIQEMEQREVEEINKGETSDARANEIIYMRLLVIKDLLQPRGAEVDREKLKEETRQMGPITAIKHIRAKTGCGLREARDMWEGFR